MLSKRRAIQSRRDSAKAACNVAEVAKCDAELIALDDEEVEALARRMVNGEPFQYPEAEAKNWNWSWQETALVVGTVVATIGAAVATEALGANAAGRCPHGPNCTACREEDDDARRRDDGDEEEKKQRRWEAEHQDE